jgi:ABC-2 type transport system ATP-binding protein
MTEIVVRCDGLVKRYGEHAAVDGVSLEVAAGEIYGLLGPNGAGKSTTIYMLAGVLDPDGGAATVCGTLVNRRSVAIRRMIGYVPQEVALWDGMSARENLLFFGRLCGLRGKHLRRRVAESLELVGLGDRADDKVNKFSGGMKRRANIAVALVHEPRLLILDEPTVGVDPQSRSAVLDRVVELARAGTAVLFASHYMEEIERTCDRVGVMDRGRLIVEGRLDELVRSVGRQPRAKLSADGDAQAALALANRLGLVADARLTGDQRLEITSNDLGRAIADLVYETERAGVHLSNIEIEQPNLETVFFSLTGKALRD